MASHSSQAPDGEPDPLRSLFPHGGDSFRGSIDARRRLPAHPGLEPGKVVAGFELLERIGQGAMGQVWLARQATLSRHVALKFIRPDKTSDEKLALFRREARAGGRLNHPGIVLVHEFGESEGLAWLAMEFVEGATTLRDVLDAWVRDPDLQSGRETQIASLVAEVADAVHVAHSAGVIHRDLKPQNILVTKDGRPKVGDFGLARIVDETGLSNSGDVMGTYAYMSPEQLDPRRKQVDRRTDVFSLGVVLYEMLTLQRPFQGDTAAQITEQIKSTDPVDPRRVRSRVPRDLAVIAFKALEKEREKRYATMADFADDLRRFLSHEPIRAQAITPFGRATRWVRRNPARSSSIFATALAVALIAFLVVQTRRRQIVQAAYDSARFAEAIAWSRGFEAAPGPGSGARAQIDAGVTMAALLSLAHTFADFELPLDGSRSRSDWTSQFREQVANAEQPLVTNSLYECFLASSAQSRRPRAASPHLPIDPEFVLALLEELDGKSPQFEATKQFHARAMVSSVMPHGCFDGWSIDSHSPEALAIAGTLESQSAHWDSAERLYAESLVADPGNVSALLGMAQINKRRGASAEAVPYFRAALAAAPNSTFMMNVLAIELRSQRRNADAARLFQRIIELNPRDGRALANLGITARDGRLLLSAAIEQLDRIDAVPNLFFNLAYLEMEYGHMDRAIEVCERGLVHFPTDPGILYNRAQARMWRKDDDCEVFEAYRAACDLGPTDTEYTSARVLASINASDRALKVAARFDDTASGDYLWLLAARISSAHAGDAASRRDDRLEGARPWLELASHYGEMAVGLNPSSGIAVTNAAESALNLCRVDRALDLLEHGLSTRDNESCNALLKNLRAVLTGNPEFAASEDGKRWICRTNWLLGDA